MSGRIIGVKVIEVSDYGRSYTASELHSTKGWKPPSRYTIRRGQRIPFPGEYFPSDQKREEPFAEAGRLMRGRTLVAVRDPQGSTRHLQRHGWYRRQQRKLAEKAGTDALAAM